MARKSDHSLSTSDFFVLLLCVMIFRMKKKSLKLHGGRHGERRRWRRWRRVSHQMRMWRRRWRRKGGRGRRVVAEALVEGRHGSGGGGGHRVQLLLGGHVVRLLEGPPLFRPSVLEPDLHLEEEEDKRQSDERRSEILHFSNMCNVCLSVLALCLHLHLSVSTDSLNISAHLYSGAKKSPSLRVCACSGLFSLTFLSAQPVRGFSPNCEY